MSAYFIANVQITDREKFEAYQKGILHTIKPFGGWILAASPGRMLEGGELKNHNHDCFKVFRVFCDSERPPWSENISKKH